MKNITDFVNESKFELQHIADYKFTWIDIKDRWAVKGNPCHKYQLVAIPNKNDGKGTQTVKVFRDFAWYKGGYDQGHASPRKFYLVTAFAGERGNGHGVDKEYKPSDYDIKLDVEDINDILSGDSSASINKEYIKKNLMEFPNGTKLSEIKDKLNH